MKKKVALSKSDTHYEGVRDVLEPLKGDLEKSLSKISSVVIKVNLVITKTSAYSQGVELATTPLKAVLAFIGFISPFYKGKIIITEEAAWGDTKEGFRMYGFSKLAKENDRVELLSLEEEIINTLGIDAGFIDSIYSLVDLTRIQWVSPTAARMLTSAGYTNAKMVSEANAEELCSQLDRVNKKNKYFKGKIGLRDVKRLIKAASYVP
jgi:hypothetical protein